MSLNLDPTQNTAKYSHSKKEISLTFMISLIAGIMCLILIGINFYAMNRMSISRPKESKINNPKENFFNNKGSYSLIIIEKPMKITKLASS